MSSSTMLRLASAVSLTALAVCAQPAIAQDINDASADCPAGQAQDANGRCVTDVPLGQDGGQAAGNEAIVVTGSRIARPNFDTIEPSVVVDSQQIEARGFDTLGQALKEQPAFGVPGSSPIGGQSDFGVGQNFVNFLGLGSQRTLTLVNGRRFVSSNTSSIFGPTGAGSQVDLNVIPTKLIDRVETIAVGGAPIYGSDAISGAINIITRRNFDGFEIDGQYAVSGYGDVPSYRVRGLAGSNFADGRGNITFAGEYNRSGGLTALDRSSLRSGLFFGNASDPNSSFLQQLYGDQRIPSISENGVPVVGGAVFGLDLPFTPENGNLFFGAPFVPGVQNAAGDQLVFDSSGRLVPLDFGQYAGRPGTFGIFYSGGNGFSLTPTTNILAPVERYSAISTAQFEISDRTRVFGEAWFSRSKGTNLRAQPVYNSGLFGPAGSRDGSLIVSVDNPFLSPEARAAILNSIANNPFSDQNVLGVQQDYFYFGRANTDLATGRSVGKTTVYRFVLGLDGDFDLGPGRWNWEITGNYGRSETRSRVRGLVQQNFLNAIDPVRDANGNIVCRPGVVNANIETLNSQCTPLNLFGNGVASQAAIDYITAIATPKSDNTQKVFNASLAGPLFKLPGGDFSVAFGYEHREESQDFQPGEFFRGERQPDGSYVSFGRSVPILPVVGEFNTDELFGEIRAELISPSTDSFINLLEVQAAGRMVDHSIAGRDFTWTAGARLKPIEDITFRGNYTRSIRAPAITEAFNPSSDFFDFADDPCDAANRGNGPAPATRAANCRADGLPDNFSALSDDRSFIQAIAGNPDLANETADSWTVGVVVEPRFIPDLQITLDYVDIKLKDVIAQLGGSTVVANCYDSSDFPNNPFCDRIDRDAQGQLSFIETGYFNSSELRYKGYLGAIRYDAETPFLGRESKMYVNLTYQYLDTLESIANAGDAPVQTDESIGYARHKANLAIGYENRGVGLFTGIQYIGKSFIDPQAAPNFYGPGVNQLEAKTFVNLGAFFSVNDRFDFQINVDNVFNTKPPFPFPASGGTITYFPGVLGTYYRVGATVSF